MSHRATFLTLAILAAILPAGCKQDQNKPGHWATCTCAYLTDYDDIAKHTLQVCVPDGTKAEDAARGCASKLAHGPVDSCSCQQPGEACNEPNTCKSNEYK